MQAVSNDSDLSYVYSAYVDDRQAPDVQSTWLPVLRVLAWFRRTETVTGQWLCVFWDEQFRHPVERVVVAWTDLNTFDPTSL